MKTAQWILFVGMFVCTVMAFTAPSVQAFQQPELARLLFFHVPGAFMTTFLLFAGAWFAFKSLRTAQQGWDIRLEASIELAMLYGVITMLTGILFSRVQWGAWWNWDPRQTSFLLTLMLVGAAIALRGAMADERVRAKASAAYMLISMLPIIFLVFVFPRLPQVVSLHPNTTISNRELSMDYWGPLLGITLFLGMTTVVIFKLRVRAAELGLKLEHLDGVMEVLGNGPTSAHVVRPVSVPEERE